MADNEILYNFEINEGTVWSSHDENGNLISQRVYILETTGANVLAHAICDIPCYPTGLFLHIDIYGKIIDLEQGFTFTENFYLKYWPKSGKIQIFSSYDSNVDISSNLQIKYIWGSSVPKTYCANGETIFGYHDFEWKKIDDYDLKEKWYVGEFKEYYYNKILSGEGSGIIPGRANEVTVWINCPEWDGETPELISCTDIDNVNIQYTGYSLRTLWQQIGLNFSVNFLSVDDQEFSFNYKIIYGTDNVCNELKDVTELIFMDPNLWCFTTRTVNKNQTTGDIAYYPMYKTTDNNGNHQAIYLLNNSDLNGEYDFLSVNGKNYIFEKDERHYESFTYGYMSSNLETKTVDNIATTEILNAVNYQDYIQNTEKVLPAHHISRYGIRNKAIESIILDPPYYDIFANEKFLAENDQLLTNKRSNYSYSNPLLLYTNHHNSSSYKGCSSLLDQFHFLLNDKVYRLPLNWNVQVATQQTTISKLVLENVNVEFQKSFNNSSNVLVLPVGFNATVTPTNPPKLTLQTINKTNLYSLRNISSGILRWDNKNWTYTIKINQDYLPLPGMDGSLGALRAMLPMFFSSNPLVETIDFNICIETPQLYCNTTPISFSPFLNNDKSLNNNESTRNLGTLEYDKIDNTTNQTYPKVGWFNKNKQLLTDINIGVQWKASTYKFSSGLTNPVDNFSFFYILLGICSSGYKTSFTSETTKSFTYAINKNIIPSDSNKAMFNGQPLFAINQTPIDSEMDEYRSVFFDTSSRYFRINDEDDWYGSSYGFDGYGQIFDINKYSDTLVYIYAWPTILKSAEISYNYQYQGVFSGSSLPFEWDTGLATNSNVIVRASLTNSSSWPVLADVLIDESSSTYVVKGTFVFYGWGPSSGTITLKLAYDYYD